MQKLSKDNLKEFLRYDENTGELYWKHRDRRWFQRTQDYSRWNNRFSGKLAGNVQTKPCGYSSKYVKILGNTYQSHIIIWIIYYGVEPSGDIDHINKNSTDNRISNLRIVTKSANMRNTKHYRNNTSGIKGVSKLNGLWRARICINSKDTHLGLFQDRFEAICARKSAEVLYGFT